MGGGDQQFVTKPCRKIGICTVFCYEGGGSENPEIVLRIMWTFPLGDAGLENLDNFPRIFPKESKNFQGSFRIFPALPQNPMWCLVIQVPRDWMSHNSINLEASQKEQENLNNRVLSIQQQTK